MNFLMMQTMQTQQKNRDRRRRQKNKNKRELRLREERRHDKKRSLLNQKSFLNRRSKIYKFVIVRAKNLTRLKSMRNSFVRNDNDVYEFVE